MKFTGVSLDYLFPFILGFFNNKILDKAKFDQLKTWHNDLLKYYGQNDQSNFFSLIVNIWFMAKKNGTAVDNINNAVQNAFDNISKDNEKGEKLILNIENTLKAIQKLIEHPVEDLTGKMSILSGYIKEHPEILDNFNNEEIQQALSDDNKSQAEIDTILTDKLGIPKEVEEFNNLVNLPGDFQLKSDVLDIYELFFDLGFDNINRDIVETIKTFLDMLSNKFIQERLNGGSINQSIINLLKKHRNMLESVNNYDDYIKFIGGDEQGLTLKDIFDNTPDNNEYEDFLQNYYIDDILKDKELLTEDRYDNVSVDKPQLKYTEILKASGLQCETLSDLVNKDADDLAEQINIAQDDINKIPELYKLFRFAIAVAKFNYNLTKNDSIDECIKKLQSIKIQHSINNSLSFYQIILKILIILIVYKGDGVVDEYCNLLKDCDRDIENIHKSNPHLYDNEFKIFQWLCIDNDKEFNNLEDLVDKLIRFKLNGVEVAEQHGLVSEIVDTIVTAFSNVDLSNNDDNLARAINALYFEPVTLEQKVKLQDTFNPNY